jgi:hypothetical protein
MEGHFDKSFGGHRFYPQKPLRLFFFCFFFYLILNWLLEAPGKTLSGCQHTPGEPARRGLRVPCGTETAQRGRL